MRKFCDRQVSLVKILCKIDMHVQRWMEWCGNVEDREYVNDVAILGFDFIINTAVMCDLSGTLPQVIQDLLTTDNNDKVVRKNS